MSALSSVEYLQQIRRLTVQWNDPSSIFVFPLHVNTSGQCVFNLWCPPSISWEYKTLKPRTQPQQNETLAFGCCPISWSNRWEKGLRTFAGRELLDRVRTKQVHWSLKLCFFIFYFTSLLICHKHERVIIMHFLWQVNLKTLFVKRGSRRPVQLHSNLIHVQ